MNWIKTQISEKRKKPETLTRGIKNCRDSRLFKGCSPLQLLCNLTGNRPQSATFHTAKRYRSFLVRKKMDRNLKRKK